VQLGGDWLPDDNLAPSKYPLLILIKAPYAGLFKVNIVLLGGLYPLPLQNFNPIVEPIYLWIYADGRR